MSDVSKSPAQIKADACIAAAFDHEDAGQWQQALVAYQQALQILPGYWRAHVNLGNVLKTLEQPDAAHQHYQLAYRANPGVYGTNYNLGLDWMRLERMELALPLLQHALALQPDTVPAMVALAEVLNALGQPEEALVWLRRAVQRQPEDTGVVMGLLQLLEQQGHYTEIDALLPTLQRSAREHAVGNLDAMAEYLRRYVGVSAALDYYRAVPLDKFSRTADDHRLMIGLYAEGLDPVQSLADHRQYNRLLPALRPEATRHGLPARPHCIGFISPDFRTHPVMDFSLGLLERLPALGLPWVGYSTTAYADEVTARLQHSASGWRVVEDLSDETLAEVIAQDGIDILIDLAGHTVGNRLGVFNLRPAPVSATWLGYPTTTGVAGMDFRIVDGRTDPPGLTEAHHSETLLRLPHSQWCYTPWRAFPAVSALPALARGHITFASFGYRAKLNKGTLRLWAALLAQLPGSRLLLANIAPGYDQYRVSALFAATGVTADRLDFVQRTADFKDYAARYQQVDVVLDTHPYTACTTVCNALYMGVPVLTQQGQTSVSRCAASLLQTVGLDDWVATDPQDFIARGQRLVADLPALAALRAGLRQRLMASPVGDQDAFARDFAALLGEMWRRKGLAAT